MSQSPQRTTERETEPQQITKTKPKFVKIDSLGPQMSGFSVYVRVGSIQSKINREYLDGTRLKIWEAVVGDESGCMILTVRDSYLDKIKENDTVVLRNAKVEMYHNFMRLSVDRWGLIEKVDDSAVSKMNVDNNKSKVEYELVNEDDDRRGGRGRRDEENKNDR